MQSSYEKRKELSNYHFDNTKYDPDVDKMTYLGNIVTNYDGIIKKYINNSKPITWETRGYKQENVEIPSQDLIEEVLDLEKNGYDKDTVISNMSWELDSTLKNIADNFGLENCMSRVHIQMPGQVWNLHIDKLEKFNETDADKVMRIVIHLTDWQYGQFWEYGTYHYNRWHAGDVVTFDWKNLPHCTANAGYHPRLTLQLTGIKTKRTEFFIKKLDVFKEVRAS